MNEIQKQKNNYCDATKVFNINSWEREIQQWIERSDTKSIIRWLVNNITLPTCQMRQSLLQDISKWLDFPDDKLRHEIYRKSMVVGCTTIEGSLGITVFLSEGSMAPPEYEPVYPPAGSEKKLLCGIISILSVSNYELPAEGVYKFYQNWSEYVRTN